MKIQIDYYKIGGIDMEKKEKTAFDILNKLQKDIPKKSLYQMKKKINILCLIKTILIILKKIK